MLTRAIKDSMSRSTCRVLVATFTGLLLLAACSSGSSGRRGRHVCDQGPRQHQYDRGQPTARCRPSRARPIKRRHRSPTRSSRGRSRPTSCRCIPARPGRSTTTTSRSLMFRPLYLAERRQPAGHQLPAVADQATGLQQRQQDRHDQHDATTTSGPTGTPSMRRTCCSSSTRFAPRSRRTPTTSGLTQRETSPTTSSAHPRPATYQVVLTLNKAYNPSWFTDTQLTYITPMPSTSWNVATAGGPHLTPANPANAKKIYDYLNAAVEEAVDLRDQPALAGRRRPVQADRVQHHDRRQHDGAEPDLRRPAEGAVLQLEGGVLRVVHGGVQRDALRRADPGPVAWPPTTCPRCRRSRHSATTCTATRTSDSTTRSSTSRTPPTTGTRSSASSTSGRRWPTSPTRQRSSTAPTAAPPRPPTARSRPSRRPRTCPTNAATNPYPYSISAASQLLSSHGWKVVPNGTTTCQSPGTGPTNCGAGIPKGQDHQLHRLLHQRPGQHRPGDDPVGLRGQAGRHQDHAVGEDVQLHRRPVRRPGRAAEQQQVGGGELRRLHREPLPDDRHHLQHRRQRQRGRLQQPEADKLIKASKFSANPNAVKAEAAFITKDLPGGLPAQPGPDLRLEGRSRVRRTRSPTSPSTGSRPSTGTSPRNDHDSVSVPQGLPESQPTFSRRWILGSQRHPRGNAPDAREPAR